MKIIICLITTIFLISFIGKSQTVSDIDGNVYETITIYSQIWMAENLKTTKFNDNTLIPIVIDNAEWASLKTAAYCNINNTTNADTINMYGRLYNWYAVNTNKLCPNGWHIPSDDDWSTLALNLGGDTVAGGKLKDSGTKHWNAPNIDATNQSNFKALPGGYRDLNGNFLSLAINALWWSNTEYDLERAKYRYLYYYFGIMFKEIGIKKEAYSVRCLKD